MKELLEQLARKHDLEWLPPISDNAMDAFETRAGFQLTSELRQLYRMCGGLRLNEWETYIMPFEAACDYALTLQEVRPAIWHYFPILDTESNPICVCCGHVMTGYVVHVYHDDVSYVKYRSIEAFLSDLVDDRQIDWSLRTQFIGSLFDASLRTPQDVETACQLRQEANTLADEWNSGRDDALQFAESLTPKTQNHSG
jgi:hypothetical protein